MRMWRDAQMRGTVVTMVNLKSIITMAENLSPLLFPRKHYLLQLHQFKNILHIQNFMKWIEA